MELQIENLKAQMCGKELTTPQKADALIEFNNLVDYVNELEEKAGNHSIVMRTGYLCELGGTKTFVVAENVSTAMDCLERISNGEDYSMQIHHSIPVVLGT